MIVIKDRKKSDLLQGLQILNKRMNLLDRHKKDLYKLEKGLEGELHFDALIKENLKSDSLIVNDLLINYNDTTIQIDSLIITNNAIYLYEVKNYKGTYQLINEQFITLHGDEIPDPTLQLKKSSQVIRRFLKDAHSHLPLVTHIVFVHPNFHLYNDQVTSPFIYANQIEDHVNTLNRSTNQLSHHRYNLANRLLEHVIVEAPYQKKLPPFQLETVKKGVSCKHCETLLTWENQRNNYCDDCKQVTSIEEAILHAVKQYRLLFSESQLTTNRINHWCGETFHLQTIRKVMMKHFQVVGKTRGTYYIPK
ncbi:nuclease-related domain-containing protein [Alkalibacterium sp. MB6]|uniref:nuclease-related domain-containing protein n=1 Tax=Alkalibacterium sp. MB6 TaxID=2081965 RepID=UPI00137A1D4E|nr:nuclease-related domain-containing protein [Alkalibacterium sp. MB6]